MKKILVASLITNVLLIGLLSLGAYYFDAFTQVNAGLPQPLPKEGTSATMGSSMDSPDPNLAYIVERKNGKYLTVKITNNSKDVPFSILYDNWTPIGNLLNKKENLGKLSPQKTFVKTIELKRATSKHNFTLAGSGEGDTNFSYEITQSDTMPKVS